MWVFDGEQWINDSAPEGGAADTTATETPKWPAADHCYPELQIIEIVPVTRREPVPPYPAV